MFIAQPATKPTKDERKGGVGGWEEEKKASLMFFYPCPFSPGSREAVNVGAEWLILA